MNLHLELKVRVSGRSDEPFGRIRAIVHADEQRPLIRFRQPNQLEAISQVKALYIVPDGSEQNYVEVGGPITEAVKKSSMLRPPRDIVYPDDHREDLLAIMSEGNPVAWRLIAMLLEKKDIDTVMQLAAMELRGVQIATYYEVIGANDYLFFANLKEDRLNGNWGNVGRVNNILRNSPFPARAYPLEDSPPKG